VLTSVDRRRRPGVTLARPHALTVEVNLVWPHTTFSEALEDDECIVMTLDAEGASAGVEHGDLARDVGLDPHTRLGAARVAQEGSENEISHGWGTVAGSSAAMFRRLAHGQEFGVNPT
jgi:hypothetical protein